MREINIFYTLLQWDVKSKITMEDKVDNLFLKIMKSVRIKKTEEREE